jgi:hypothetical protein
MQRFLPFSAPAAAPLLHWTAYVGAAGTGDAVKAVSLTVLDDFSTQAGLSSLAAALAFVRPPMPHPASGTSEEEAVGSCFVEAGSNAVGETRSEGCLLLPSRVASGLTSSVRVGLVHLPAQENQDSGKGGAGALVSLLWAVVTAGAGNGGSDACSHARSMALQVCLQCVEVVACTKKNYLPPFLMVL